METLLGLLFILGCVGIWYFARKKPNKRNRNISIAIVVFSVLIMGFLPTGQTQTNSDSKEKTESKKTESSEKPLSSSEIQQSKEASESKEKEKIAQSESKEKERIAAEEARKINEEKTKASKEAEEQKKSDITILSDKPTTEQETTLEDLASQQFKQQFPYKGSKMHSVLGVIQPWTQSDGRWYKKVQATIVNGFGAEQDTTIEIHITPASATSGTVEIINY
ncbi:hypothetical protein P7D77_14650 [Enterococcus avium]|uniref:hypothetical protein n=1 Tax=Enterococcus TaxID=1350 RepID=UPI0020737C46|nr:MULTISPECIES: hypothetical protein [Enterococcus]MDT2399200.1 hypothetical protein [Enterococcus avium]MDT2450616.1 hypothetical protein [Enterococcus avium]